MIEACVDTVLVADDDAVFRRACERELGHERRVLCAGDFETALAVAAEHPVCIAVVDLRLGPSSGIELVRAMKELQPASRIALVSGYLSVAFAVAAVRAGADAVLFKPITCAEILRAVGAEPDTVLPGDPPTPTLARMEWEHITRVLVECGGNVSMAARRLGIYRQSLQRRLRKYSPRV